MRVIDAMLAMRHGPLEVPLVLYVPELGVSLEVTTVRAASAAAYMTHDGTLWRGDVVVLEAGAPNGAQRVGEAREI